MPWGPRSHCVTPRGLDCDMSDPQSGEPLNAIDSQSQTRFSQAMELDDRPDPQTEHLTWLTKEGREMRRWRDEIAMSEDPCSVVLTSIDEYCCWLEDQIEEIRKTRATGA